MPTEAIHLSKINSVRNFDKMEALFGELYNWFALCACFLLVLMILVICGDVLLRNVPIPGFPRGIAIANDFSENALYLITLLTAPWLLRRGQHIRVDFVLRAIKPSFAWLCEWVADVAALAACCIITWYGALVAFKSYQSGAVQIRTFVTPEWWYLAPIPAIFVLLVVELVFRMRRLYAGPREPRNDAVSSA